MNNPMIAVLLLSLSRFDNEDLAALNLAIEGFGRIDQACRAYQVALEANLIRDNGVPYELEELREACAYEVNRRVQAGTFA